MNQGTSDINRAKKKHLGFLFWKQSLKNKHRNKVRHGEIRELLQCHKTLSWRARRAGQEPRQCGSRVCCPETLWSLGSKYTPLQATSCLLTLLSLTMGCSIHQMTIPATGKWYPPCTCSINTGFWWVSQGVGHKSLLTTGGSGPTKLGQGPEPEDLVNVLPPMRPAGMANGHISPATPISFSDLHCGPYKLS